MTDKTCKTCTDNDDGLCDRLGTLVEDDDTCEKHRDRNMSSREAGDDQKRREDGL